MVIDPPASAGVPFEVAAANRRAAAEELFEVNRRAFSIGVGLADRNKFDSPANWAFHVMSDRNVILPQGEEVPIPRRLRGVPVRVREVSHVADDVQTAGDFLTMSALPLGKQPPGASCEQQRVRPLVCGLKVENPAHGTGPGSTGCFVLTGDGAVALMSNNHVIAGSNRGSAGEVIHQPGSPDPAASLIDYPQLLTVPDFNSADIALATLESGMGYSNTFHPSRGLWPLTHFLSDAEIVQLVAGQGNVFKVGLNGYAEGRVDQLLVQTKPIDYGYPGYCRFIDVIVSVHRTDAKKKLAAPGDSGAPIFDGAGSIVGIHFAGGVDEETGDDVSWACTPSGMEAAFRGVFGPGFVLQLAPGGIA